MSAPNMILIVVFVFALSFCFICARFLRDRHEIRELLSPVVIPEAIALPVATIVTLVHVMEEGIQTLEVNNIVETRPNG